MGFNDTSAPDVADGYMAPGSVGLYPEGNQRLTSYRAPASIGKAGATEATLIADVPGGINGHGSVVAYRSSPSAGSDCTLFVGSGSVNRDGSIIATASSRMQMKPAASAPFELGLDPPSTPVIVVEATGGTKLDGAYSLVATIKRTITNGESNPSPATAPLVVPAGGRLKATVPPQSSFALQVDVYRIYSTIANFATIGARYLVVELKYGIDVPVGGGDVYLDFYDADLLGIASPTTYFKPPDCTHLFTLGGYVAAAGCYPVGGWGISPSILNRPDAYDPDTVIFLNPGAPITACSGRAGDGFQYVACRDSLHGIILTGDPTAPMLARVLWGNDGFLGPNQFCYVDTELWGQSSARGPVRTQQGQEPDRSFAQPVLRTIEAMGSGAIVGFDPYSNQVVWAQGTTALAYMRGLGGNIWSAPITLPGAVQSKVSIGGRLHLVIGGQLYQWNAGAAVTWVFQPFLSNNGGQWTTVTEYELDATADVNLSWVIGETYTIVAGPTVVALTQGHSGYKSANITGRSYAPRLTGSNAINIFRILCSTLVMRHRA